jgi:hypothetical protein
MRRILPFFQVCLKNAALTGTNANISMLRRSADSKFLNSCMADTLGVTLPNTAILPSVKHSTDTTSKTFRNLKFTIMYEIKKQNWSRQTIADFQ